MRVSMYPICVKLKHWLPQRTGTCLSASKRVQQSTVARFTAARPSHFDIPVSELRSVNSAPNSLPPHELNSSRHTQCPSGMAHAVMTEEIDALRKVILATLRKEDEEMILRDLRSSAVGLLAAALMFVGDVLLYGPSATSHPAAVYFDHIDPAAPAAALLASPMAEIDRLRAIAGGLLGPLAGLLYIVAGVGQFVRPEYGVAGWLAGAGHCVSMVVVASYHAAYPYTAFIAKAHQTCEATKKLLGACNVIQGAMQDHAAYMAAMKTVVGWGIHRARASYGPTHHACVRTRTRSQTRTCSHTRTNHPRSSSAGLRPRLGCWRFAAAWATAIAKTKGPPVRCRGGFSSSPRVRG